MLYFLVARGQALVLWPLTLFCVQFNPRFTCYLFFGLLKVGRWKKERDQAQLKQAGSDNDANDIGDCVPRFPLHLQHSDWENTYF